tara:strand:+ start:428 stop:1039 length:612 start_codon:yes stop_codon:yes gene_type:complete
LKELIKISKNISQCTACALSNTRTQTVAGSGSQSAEIMFIGEAPGSKEDLHGLPFVGRSGDLLDELLVSINLDRQSVFITNLIKCRPPDNRDPLTKEIQACKEFLKKQLQHINPKVIVTLGRHAFSYFFPNANVQSSRGQIMPLGELSVFPVYHPAAALYNPKLKSVLQDDFKKLSDYLQNSITNKKISKTPSNEAKQLNLFE